jgi:putative SOS response-associated peptidase YedK
MCGRYTIRELELLRAGLGIVRKNDLEDFTERRILPRFNAAPSQTLPIVRTAHDGSIELTTARWGFVPFWTKDKPKLAPINAKCETVATSAMFRQAFKNGRCLVPADGFYEWKGAKPPKQPHFIHLRGDGIFAFAGLWSRWNPPDGRSVDTFTILTTTPNELMAPIHNRMPVILHESDYEAWLSRSDPRALFRPFEASVLEAYPVSSHINSPKHDDPLCIKREIE